VTGPREGARGSGAPRERDAATPRERNAAAAKAMRRRERREAHAGGRAPTEQRRTRPRPASTVDTAERERPSRAATRSATRSATRAVTRSVARERPPSHRRVLVRRSVAISVPLVVAALVAVVLWTPVLGVRGVDVVGTRTLTAAQVVAAARVPHGTPMARLDTAAVAARVHELTRVATVDVSRDWPSTVRITVTERDPIGYLVESDGVHLVDRTGLDYSTVTRRPAGLPRLTLTGVAPTDPRTRAVVAVLGTLPAPLRTLVRTAGAKTPGSVTLGLTHGRTVRWGDATDSTRKAEVLAALMTRHGKVYDVSSPALPTVS
jgi:cell division protein FtsQ